MRWKRWMRWKKNNSPLFTAFLKKITAKFTAFLNKNSPHWISKFYSIWLKFTRNFKDVSESWRSGLSSGRHAGGQRFEHVCGRFFFVRILRTRWKNNSPRFTAFTAKRCKNYAVKIFFLFTAFPRISYENSPPNLDPGFKNLRKNLDPGKDLTAFHVTSFQVVFFKLYRGWENNLKFFTILNYFSLFCREQLHVDNLFFQYNHCIPEKSWQLDSWKLQVMPKDFTKSVIFLVGNKRFEEKIY